MEPRDAPDDGFSLREATPADAASMARVEAAARALLAAHGVDLDSLEASTEVEEKTSWDLALVAELHGRVVGMVRCTDLGAAWLAVDQVSVEPAYAHRGLGRRLLTRVASQAREVGYHSITGTTFRAVPFNAPFYAGLEAAEDPVPHPAMVERRRVEREVGLDRLGERVVMRLSVGAG